MTTLAAPAGLALATVVDRVGEIMVAAGTLIAVVAVGAALPALMRRIRKLALGQVSTPGKPSVA